MFYAIKKYFLRFSIVSGQNGTHVWIMWAYWLPPKIITCASAHTTLHCMLLCFNIIWHFRSFYRQCMRCAFFVSSAAIFGSELFPRAITFVQWCNRNVFFRFIFRKKWKRNRREMNVIVQFLLHTYIKCACSPNQNGNGRAELKNELYANVADSNGNESHEWLERWEREREKI